MEQPGYITIQSKSDRKEWFNICLYNDISSNIVNSSLITQSVNYKLDDKDWQTFTVPYNTYMRRLVLYGYQVTLGDYTSEVDPNNFAYNIVENNYGKFSATLSYEYDAYGDVFMNNLIGIEINEIDDMTAQELLTEIQSLHNELNEVKQSLTNSYINVNTINLYATKAYVGSYVTSKHYLTEHQNLSSYATKSYVNDKINSIDMSSYLTYHQDLSAYATKAYVGTYVESKNYLTQHQSLNNYATKSYVLDKINSITNVTYEISYTGNIDFVDDLTNKDGIIRHSSEMFRTIEAKDGKLNVLTYNLDKASYTDYGVIKTDNVTIQADDNGIIRVLTNGLEHSTVSNYGISKGDQITIKSNNGILSVDTRKLSYATYTQPGIILVDSYSLTVNEGKIEVNRYNEIESILDRYNAQYELFSYDIENLKNRTSKLETAALQEVIEFLIPIGDPETELPQPIFDRDTWTVNHYSDRKTISFSIKTNCKFNVNVEYKNGTNNYSQVELISLNYNNQTINANQLANTIFNETGNSVNTIYFTFAVKNYDKDDNLASINTQVIISATSIHDSSIKQTQFHIFKCWNNKAFEEDKPVPPEIPEEIIIPESYIINNINNNYNGITSYSYWNVSYNSLPNVVKEFISDKNIYANIINIDPSLYLSYSYLDNIDCVILTGSTCMFTPNWITEGENKEIRTIDNTYYYPNDINNSSTFILYSYEIFNNTIKYRSSLLIENSYITGIINFENGNYESQYLQLFNSDKWNNIISQNNQLTLYLNSSYIEQSILDIPYLGELI